jgi:hypothetical protein
MHANAVFRQPTAGTDSNNAGDAPKTNAEEMLSARRRLEDRFRQAFAERARQDDEAHQYGCR